MGYIYILHHELFDDNLYKIGMTKHLKSRLSSYNVGYPTNCNFVYTKDLNNLTMRNIERQIHKKMDDYRIVGKNEFFKIDLNHAINIIETTVQNNNQEFIIKEQKQVMTSKEQYWKEQIQINTTDKHCKYCNKYFSYYTNLLRHLKNGCKTEFDEISNYERKLNIEVPEAKIFQCRFCLLQLADKHCYSRHTRNGCTGKTKYKIELEKKMQLKYETTLHQQITEEKQDDEVPNHLRDESRDNEGFGHGKGYLYPHSFKDHFVAQQYLPDSLQGKVFYNPGKLGYEKIIGNSVLSKR